MQLEILGRLQSHSLKSDNVRVIPDAGDVVIVGADTIAKLSAETSKDRSVAAWDQRIVITRLWSDNPVSILPRVNSYREAIRCLDLFLLRLVGSNC